MNGHESSGVDAIAHPAEMLTTNLRIDTNVIDAAAKTGVQRHLYISGATVYPPEAPAPTPEDRGRMGLPETSARGASLAKRVGEVQAWGSAAEYGMEVAPGTQHDEKVCRSRLNGIELRNGGRRWDKRPIKGILAIGVFPTMCKVPSAS